MTRPSRPRSRPVSPADPVGPDEAPLGLAGGAGTTVRAFAPGRVNLIGEHTDYAGGLALPMAVHLGTTVDAVRTDSRLRLRSDHDPAPLDVELPVTHPRSVAPPWGRYAAAVAAVLAGTAPPDGVVADRAGDHRTAGHTWGGVARSGVRRGLGPWEPVGLDGTITTTLPVGAGLSSSAALEVAVALALGASGPAAAVASLARDAEEVASGVPCGLMDQLASACGLDGHALLVDFAHGTVTPVRFPDGLAVVVVHSGQVRRLADSPYAVRRREIESAIVHLGDPRTASDADLTAIADPVLRRRARHLVSENERVLALVEALAAGEAAQAGSILDAGHASLRHDLEVSTPQVDELCDHLRSRPGVHGVRLTGAGFGGCVVALAEPGALDQGWEVRPGPGATVTTLAT